MNKRNLLTFLGEVGVAQVTNGGEWVNLSCPLARWTHSSGSDRKPSFGVSINDKAESYYKCFTCQIEPRPLSNLLHEIWRREGVYPFELSKLHAHLEVFDRGEAQDQIPDYVDQWVSHATSSVCDFIPQTVVDSFPKASKEIKWAHSFLVSRGISEKTYSRFNIRVAHNHNLLIPLTNIYGSTIMMEYRSTLQKRVSMFKAEDVGIKHLAFPKKKEGSCWFGLHLVDWKLPLLLVEGALDAMRVYEMGFHNVVASSGTGVTKSQLKAIHSSSVIVGMDNDEAGKQASRRIKKLLDSRATVWFADWSLINKKDPGDIRKKDEFLTVMDNLKEEI